MANDVLNFFNNIGTRAKKSVTGTIDYIEQEQAKKALKEEDIKKINTTYDISHFFLPRKKELDTVSVPGAAISNIPYNLASTTYEAGKAIASPLQTIGDLGKAFAGGVQRPLDLVMDKKNVDFFFGGNDYRKYSDAINADMLENYGSWGGIKDRIGREPVEFALDAASLGLGSAALKGSKVGDTFRSKKQESEATFEGSPNADPQRVEIMRREAQYRADNARVDELIERLDTDPNNQAIYDELSVLASRMGQYESNQRGQRGNDGWEPPPKRNIPRNWEEYRASKDTGANKEAGSIGSDVIDILFRKDGEKFDSRYPDDQFKIKQDAQDPITQTAFEKFRDNYVGRGNLRRPPTPEDSKYPPGREFPWEYAARKSGANVPGDPRGSAEKLASWGTRKLGEGARDLSSHWLGWTTGAGPYAVRGALDATKAGGEQAKIMKGAMEKDPQYGLERAVPLLNDMLHERKRDNVIDLTTLPKRNPNTIIDPSMLDNEWLIGVDRLFPGINAINMNNLPSVGFETIKDLGILKNAYYKEKANIRERTRAYREEILEEFGLPPTERAILGEVFSLEDLMDIATSLTPSAEIINVLRKNDKISEIRADGVLSDRQAKEIVDSTWIESDYNIPGILNSVIRTTNAVGGASSETRAVSAVLRAFNALQSIPREIIRGANSRWTNERRQEFENLKVEDQLYNEANKANFQDQIENVLFNGDLLGSFFGRPDGPRNPNRLDALRYELSQIIDSPATFGRSGGESLNFVFDRGTGLNTAAYFNTLQKNIEESLGKEFQGYTEARKAQDLRTQDIGSIEERFQVGNKQKDSQNLGPMAQMESLSREREIFETPNQQNRSILESAGSDYVRRLLEQDEKGKQVLAHIYGNEFKRLTPSSPLRRFGTLAPSNILKYAHGPLTSPWLIGRMAKAHGKYTPSSDFIGNMVGKVGTFGNFGQKIDDMRDRIEEERLTYNPNLTKEGIAKLLAIRTMNRQTYDHLGSPANPRQPYVSPQPRTPSRPPVPPNDRMSIINHILNR